MMKRVMFIFTLLLLTAAAVFGQDTIPPITPPTDWGDVIMNPEKWFGSFAAVAALTVFVAAFFNNLLKIVKAFPRQLIAWGVGVVLMLGSNLLNIGYGKEFPLLLSAIHGVAVGLASNGMYNVPWVKSVLDWIDTLFKPKP